MDFKAIFEDVDSHPIPSGSTFMSDSYAQMSISYPTTYLGKTESASTIVDLRNLSSPMQFSHAETEKLVSYSPDGQKRAVLRSVPFSQTMMPVNTPKAAKENVNYLEIFQGQRRIHSELLTEKNGNFMTFSTITSGLVWSPDSQTLAWISADDSKFERKSRLGFTMKMHHEKDYGEDIDGVYRTILVTFSLKTMKTTVIGAPDAHGSSCFAFASNDVILLQAVDLTSERLLGIRSYTNRPFHLFAVRLSDQPVFKLLSDRINIFPSAIQIDDASARISTFVFPTDFGGHDSPLFPFTAILDLKELAFTSSSLSSTAISVFSVPVRPFISKSEICATIERECLLVPVTINLESFEVKDLLQLPKQTDSAIIDDVRSSNFLLRIASPSSLPRAAYYSSGVIQFISEEFDFGYTSEVLHLPNSTDAIIITNTDQKKKFIVVPHGGPHGMTSTYWSRMSIIFAKAGFSVALVNYRGSTGYPLEVIKTLPGNCGRNDVDDVMSVIRELRKKYEIEKLGIWGFSHGGFLSCHIAGQFSSEIDFAVAGGPVVDFVSSYFSCDIPDWALVESGLSSEADGEIGMSSEALAKMLNASPIKYANDVRVPMLFVHGKNDRRVSYLQSVEMYLRLKKLGKPAYMLIYEGNNHSFPLRSCFDDLLASSIAFFCDPLGFIAKDPAESVEVKKDEEKKEAK